MASRLLQFQIAKTSSLARVSFKEHEMKKAHRSGLADTNESASGTHPKTRTKGYTRTQVEV